MIYSNMQRKESCRFFKWLDKPTCERGMEVLPELLKNVKELENENDSCLARIKDLENENDSCMASVVIFTTGNCCSTSSLLQC
jgi:hypothetical protein